MNTSSPTSLKKPFLGLPSATSSRSPSGSNQTVKVSLWFRGNGVYKLEFSLCFEKWEKFLVFFITCRKEALFQYSDFGVGVVSGSV